MKKIVLKFVFLLTSLPAIVSAQTYWGGELPIISDTKLKMEVTLAGDVYNYKYIIVSGSTNTGQLWSFDIDVKEPEGGIDLSGEGLVNGPGYLKHTSAQVLSEPTTPKMIPVGLFSPPNWNSGPSILGQVGWGSDDVKDRILPGGSLEGFMIISRGIPGIREFVIEPKLVPPSEESGITPKQIQEVQDKVSFKGRTVGPTAPPKDFVPIEFLNYLITLLHDSRKLGWVKVDGVHQSLLAKLTNAKRKMEAGENAVAKNMLNAFLNEVRAVSCPDFTCPGNKPLTSEAYALLFFNGQFLWERLQ